MSGDGKKKEIYTYDAPWVVYAANWSVRATHRFRLAIGSFIEEYNNKVGSPHNFPCLLFNTDAVVGRSDPVE
jgi:hypothetical protein